MLSMKNTILFMSLSLMVVCVSCGGDEGGADNEHIGTSCQSNEDCGGAAICNANNLCVACQSCQVRADCPEDNICDQELNCCIPVECTNDDECADPLYCSDYTCREKKCEDQSDCTRVDHVCLPNTDGENVCTNPGCTAHEDCDTKLCNMETHKCDNCHQDSDCPDDRLECSNGYCVVSNDTDGDGSHDRLGCEAFQSNCLIDIFTCFDKINPPAEFASCTKLKDGETTVGFTFMFPDSSMWITHTDVIPNTYDATGTSGYCYHIELNAVEGYLEYHDSEGAVTGRYRINELLDEVEVVCPDDTHEYYNLTTLRDEECYGFVESGIYEPPEPGIAACE